MSDRIVYFGELLYVSTLCDVYYKEHLIPDLISVQTWTYLSGWEGAGKTITARGGAWEK